MKLEAHLNELAAPDAAALRALVVQLRALPERVPSADLTDRILAAADREHALKRRFRAPSPWWGVAAAAALLIALAGFYAALERVAPQPADSGSDSAAWLSDHQEADGTWDPLKHGGAAEYRPALTALAALALDRSPAGREPRIERACAALAAMQTPDGAFGGSGRAQLYNHAITTYALATLYPRHPALQPTLKQALGFIGKRQTPEGGWDYEAGSEGNAAISSWQLRALASASEHGFAEADVPLRKGLRWLRASARDDGSIAYHRGSAARSEGLTALAAYTLITAGKEYPGLPALGQHVAGSLRAEPAAPAGADCYRDYAKVLAFESAGSQPQADAVRGQMLKRRQAGSQDQWEKVGGQLYTSALTALVAKR